MKQLIATFVMAIFLVSLFSCSEHKGKQSDNQPANTPRALQSKEGSKFTLSSSRTDLLDDIYLELVENSQLLKELKRDIDSLPEKQSELNEVYYDYETKSVNYYNAAKLKASSIKDTVLQKRLSALLQASLDRYESKSGAVSSLREMIEENNLSISDRHLFMKIALTLPIIEKYQTDNLPSEKPFKDFIITQNAVVAKLDSLSGLK